MKKSDTCGGQNHNINVAAMCLYATQNTNLHTINQIYMEKGHSQMEVDSCHSIIERALKSVNIYYPTDYYTAVRMARVGQPYRMHQISTHSILDFKSMVGPKRHVLNRGRDDSGATLNWLKIKWLRYEKSMPGIIKFKYEYDDDFRVMTVNKGLRGRKSTMPNNIPPFFESPPGITKAKYGDLRSLCECLAIPADYQAFYSALSINNVAVETLPELDVEDVVEGGHIV